MYEISGLEELIRWVQNANDYLRAQNPPFIQGQTVARVKGYASGVAQGIADEYPFYASELPTIVENMFVPAGNGLWWLNAAEFGQLFCIVRHLKHEPVDVSMWKKVHPRIESIAKGLYEDGYYSMAANRSMVEVEVRLREVFVKLKPDAITPSKVGDLIGGLLSESGAYHFCDISTQSGRDYRRGIKSLFEGAFAAFRNPSSHENTDMRKGDAFDQIVLASQLMKVLDDA